MKTLILAALLLVSAPWTNLSTAKQSTATASKNLKLAKFYVEIPFDVKMGQIIEVTARDTVMGRLEAFAAMGATVWTENEWKEAQARLQEDNFPIHILSYEPQRGWVEKAQ